MADEIDAAFERIAARIRIASVEGARECAKMVGSALGKKVRRSRPVLDQDLIPGYVDPSRKVTIREIPKGSEVELSPSYVRLSPELRAVVVAVDPASLMREGLLVKDRKGAKRHYQGLDDAPRLKEWSRARNQVERKVIWTGNPLVATAAFVTPVLKNVRFAKVVSEAIGRG